MNGCAPFVGCRRRRPVLMGDRHWRDDRGAPDVVSMSAYHGRGHHPDGGRRAGIDLARLVATRWRSQRRPPSGGPPHARRRRPCRREPPRAQAGHQRTWKGLDRRPPIRSARREGGDERRAPSSAAPQRQGEPRTIGTRAWRHITIAPPPVADAPLLQMLGQDTRRRLIRSRRSHGARAWRARAAPNRPAAGWLTDGHRKVDRACDDLSRSPAGAAYGDAVLRPDRR